ncbi:hypothetical protein [Microcoleus sp. S11D4]|uniref:hypothetical protein n=1 Tax=Microcoleus sp. S11D4 TaxID=3055407 RepID=UPI002FD097FE
MPALAPLNITRIYGVDAGLRYLCLETDLPNKSSFSSVKVALHKAKLYQQAKQSFQRKDNRSASRILIVSSGRKRRFIADANTR